MSPSKSVHITATGTMKFTAITSVYFSVSPKVETKREAAKRIPAPP
jgi:hypothetical protein